MKVFIGTANITDAPALLKQGFRKLGYEADVGLVNCSHKFYATPGRCARPDSFDKGRRARFLHDGASAGGIFRDSKAL